ncbi:MAG: DUF935 domain-containing protein [Bacillota bacterium]
MAEILGPDGKPIRQPRPETREIAVASIRDRWSSYPSSGLTPERLTRILREADQGNLERWAELAEEMEEKDGHLGSIMGTRKLAVLGLDWTIQPYESDNPRDQELAEFVRWAIDQIADWEGSLLDVLDALGKGLSVSELMWQIRDGKAIVERLKWVHLKRFRFDENDQFRLMTDADPAGIPLLDNKFLVHRYKARSGHASRAGLHRTTSWLYLFKNWDIKDWVSYAEIYGQPLRVGYYEPGATEDDKRALMQALVTLASDAAGILPKSADIKFITDALRATGGDVFQALAMFCNAEMSKSVLGQTLTTEVGKTGSYSASQTHQQVRQDLLEADCKAVAETLRQQLIRPLVLFNFGREATSRLPWIRFATEPPEDLKQTAGTYKVLISDIGLPVAKEHLYERFGIPKPEANQELVVPPSRQAAALANRRGTEQLILANRRADAGREQIEALAVRAREQAAEIMSSLETQVRDVVRSASSLEDIRDRLVALYADLDTTELEELIGRATMAADLFGRWTVNRDG